MPKMMRSIIFIFAVFFLTSMQGCSTIADVPYHPVCAGKSGKCSTEDVERAVYLRDEIGIQDTGWHACLTSNNPPLKGPQALIDDYQCSPTSASILKISYTQAWLEYKDGGEQQDPLQMTAVLDWIRKEPGPLFILVYVHGWHHNADTSNGNPRNNAIKFPLLMAREVDTLKRMALDKKIAMPRVLGIYIGWRGEKYKSLIPQYLSISSRSVAADTIGRRGVLKKNLMDVANTARLQSNDSRMMVIGHSLGGRMLTSMFMPDLDNGNPQPLGSNTLVVTINPAVGADCYDGVLGEGGRNPDTPRPRWINITSEDDKATNSVYSLAHSVGLVEVCNKDSAAKNKAVGHYKPYLREVIDQARYVDGGDPQISNCMKNSVLFSESKEPSVWEPDWYRQVNRRLLMAFPTRNDSSRSQKIKTDYTVCVGVEDGTLPAKVLNRGVWNVRSDKSLIDFEEGGDNTSGFHNGIISTILVRLLTETLYF
ncbi:hypothetical protein ACN22W_34315 [Burkholderia theae]|uniref:hypothetical protein n=1 Tax=Burkholderia theae TaxID=3143496 RepID=UPI003AFB1BF2